MNIIRGVLLNIYSNHTKQLTVNPCMETGERDTGYRCVNHDLLTTLTMVALSQTVMATTVPPVPNYYPERRK